jgi:hypothetical protein
MARARGLRYSIGSALRMSLVQGQSPWLRQVRSLRGWVLGLASLVVALGMLAVPAPGGAAAKPQAAARSKNGCRVHAAQSFLKRDSFVKKRLLQGPAHQKALRWRVERYGHVAGMGHERWSSQPATAHATAVRFLGLPVQVHEKIVPALGCVERRIRSSCSGKGQRYVPRAIGGFRESNTYRGGEVSNHLFGIAIDIDPERNPCCGCVDPWPSHPLCKREAKSVFERTALPRCWVEAFERHGFYWLGKDSLRDTMHFEYLGDPDR